MLDYILHLSPGILIALVIVIFIGLVSQCALYAKAGEPWAAALVPVWNVMIFVDLVGRPKWQSWIIMVPGTIIFAVILIWRVELNGLFPVIDKETLVAMPGPSQWKDVMVPLIIIALAAMPMMVFTMIIFTEICDSFGQHKTSDKVMAIIFNAGYILFGIALSQAQYEAPWYKKKRGIPYTLPEDPKKIRAAQMVKAQEIKRSQGRSASGRK